MEKAFDKVHLTDIVSTFTCFETCPNQWIQEITDSEPIVSYCLSNRKFKF